LFSRRILRVSVLFHAQQCKGVLLVQSVQFTSTPTEIRYRTISRHLRVTALCSTVDCEIWSFLVKSKALFFIIFKISKSSFSVICISFGSQRRCGSRTKSRDEIPLVVFDIKSAPWVNNKLTISCCPSETARWMAE
jgi:hypothetical protein